VPSGGVPLQRESCEDNPLLVQCLPAYNPVPAPSTSTEPAPAPLGLGDPSLAPIDQAEAILGARCGSCHGPANSCGTCDGLRDIDDMGKMIDSGKILPCNWRGSPVAQRISRGEMPPRSSNQPPPTGQELAILANFVDGLCDSLTADGPVVSGQAALESWLANDCGSCHGKAPADAGVAERVPLLDVPELVELGVIVPCNPDGSLLVQRLRDGSMPPPDAPKPTPREVRDLVAFIERPCSRR
jgi:mono/diheme cytochrome c family protein